MYSSTLCHSLSRKSVHETSAMHFDRYFSFRLGHEGSPGRTWFAGKRLCDESSGDGTDRANRQDSQCARIGLLRDVQILRTCSNGQFRFQRARFVGKNFCSTM